MDGPTLKLYSTLTRRIEPFEPIEPGHVRMYHCGPTVYGYPHIGNLSAFMFADVLRRTMEIWGYRVTQVMNITDVGHLTHDDAADASGEDKLERAARRLRRSPWDLARHYTHTFWRDLEALDIRAAHYYPRATEFVPEMVALTERLLEKGLAYRAGDNVYFDVSRFPGYGKLSGNSLEELDAGARIAVRKDKRSPHDFALWKADPKHIMQWPSPFGTGFPGWHIECSAMAMRFLGETIDIHTGGEDNIFPHHECEIAQSEGATGKPFAQVWMHTRFMSVDGKKMSKSLGNCFTLQEILARGYSAREVRYALIKTHYRTQPNFTFSVLDDARRALKRIDAFVYAVDRARGEELGDGATPFCRDAEAAFRDALADDLNVSRALAALWGLVNEGNRRTLTPGEAADVRGCLGRMDELWGVIFWSDPFAEAGPEAPTAATSVGPSAASSALGRPEAERLAKERRAARARKDYAEADRLRDAISELGFTVEDRPEGWRLVSITA